MYENNKSLLIFSVVIVAIPLILNGHLKKNIYNYSSQTLTFKSNLTSIQNMTVKNPHLDLVFLAGSYSKPALTIYSSIFILLRFTREAKNYSNEKVS